MDELYGSHLPLLSRIIDLTRGPVLEIGMGKYSTPYLHTICELQQRQLTSMDNDPMWYKENTKWVSNYHTIAPLVKDWDMSFDAMVDDDIHWSVVFVDEKPARHRIKSLKFFANRANFVIVHDSEQASEKFFKYRWAYPLYTYRYDYTKLIPNTTVLSNFIDLSFL